MPQTREHLDICRLLGVRRGLVAVTKSDLLPGAGRRLAPAPARRAAGRHRRQLPGGRPGPPLLHRDRRGAAGAARRAGPAGRRGHAAPGRRAAAAPHRPGLHAQGLRHRGHRHPALRRASPKANRWRCSRPPPGREPLRVRTLQVHGAPVKQALAGQRTAVNLPGLEAGEISRGQALTRAGVVPPSSLLDVEVTLLPAAPQALRHRARLLLHVGTAQVQATVSLQDRAELAPGATALAQLRLAEPVAALPGQRFILRGFAKLDGRGATLAGGRVLSIAAPRRRRGRAESLAQLAALAGDAVDARVAAVLAMAGPGRARAPGRWSAGPPSPRAPSTRRWCGSRPAARRSWSTGRRAPGWPARWPALSPPGCWPAWRPTTASTRSTPAWGARRCAGCSRRWPTRASSSGCWPAPRRGRPARRSTATWCAGRTTGRRRRGAGGALKERVAAELAARRAHPAAARRAARPAAAARRPRWLASSSCWSPTGRAVRVAADLHYDAAVLTGPARSAGGAAPRASRASPRRSSRSWWAPPASTSSRWPSTSTGSGSRSGWATTGCCEARGS